VDQQLLIPNVDEKHQLAKLTRFKKLTLRGFSEEDYRSMKAEIMERLEQSQQPLRRLSRYDIEQLYLIVENIGTVLEMATLEDRCRLEVLSGRGFYPKSHAQSSVVYVIV